MDPTKKSLKIFDLKNTTLAYNHKILWQGITYLPHEFKAYTQTKLSENIEEWEKDIFAFAAEWMNEKNEQFLVQTSGSTSQAKTISLNRKDMIASAYATASYLSLQPNKAALLCLPAKYIAGKMMIVRALITGMDLYYKNPGINISENINRDFQFAAMIPLQIQYAIDKGLYDKLNKISTIIIGGAPLHLHQINKLQKIESEVYATYGMTETITHIAMQKINGRAKEDCFSCLEGVYVEKNQEDCLIIHSDKLGQFTTNDIGEIISSKKFRILGRKDFIINSGGLKINPEQLEQSIAHLIPHPFVITYKNDDILGQKLVLLIESQHPSSNFQYLLQKIKEHIPSKFCPKMVYTSKQLIRTSNYKIDRKAHAIFINSID